MQKLEKRKEIRTLKTQLQRLGKKGESNAKQIQQIKEKIAKREELLNAYSYSISLISKEMNNTNSSKMELENRLKDYQNELKKVYDIIYRIKISSNKYQVVTNTDNYQKNLLLTTYISHLNKISEKYINEISNTKASLSNKIEELAKDEKEKQAIAASIHQERKNLIEDKSQKEKVASQIENKQSDLKVRIKKEQKESIKLDKAIQDAIAKEFASAKKKDKKRRRGHKNKHADEQKEDSKGNENQENQENLPETESPESKEMSDQFSENKSKLPWPVEKGYVCEKFGIYEHPELRGVMVNNNGAKFCSPNGSIVKSIFSGEVRYIIPMSSGGKFILIKHGNYFSVYSNLSQVFVKAGQQITSRQVLGTVGDNPTGKGASMELQIWQGCCKKLNPEKWLLRR